MADAYYNKQGQLVLDLTDVPADIARIIERAVVEAPDEATFWWRVADDLAKLVNKFRDENAFLWALLEECRGNSFERLTITCQVAPRGGCAPSQEASE